MATVVGKTSTRIDDLLAPLVVELQIVDGNLLYTLRDGTVINAGGVGDHSSVTRIFYTSGSYPTRPTGVLCVEWIGPTQPPSMTAQDTWLQSG